MFAKDHHYSLSRMLLLFTNTSEIPYFEGDFWSSTIEDLLKELDIEEEDRRKMEELEAVKASDDGCFDDSVEPDEPTEV